MAKMPSSSLYTSTRTLAEATSSSLGGTYSVLSAKPPHASLTPAVEEYPVYVIHIGPPSASRFPLIYLECVYTQMNRSGDIADGQEHSSTVGRVGSASQNWQFVDGDLHSRIELLVRNNGGRDRSLVLTHPDALPVLADIVETGRAKLGDIDGPTLSFGATRSGHIEWTPVGTDFWQAHLKLDGGTPTEQLQLLCAATAVWIDPLTGEIGLVDVGQSPEVVRDLLRFSRVQVLRNAQTGLESSRQEGGSGTSANPDLALSRVVQESPTPVLTLFCADKSLGEAPKQRKGKNGNAEHIPLARLSFQYGEYQIPAYPRTEVTTLLDGATPVWIHRDLTFEDRAWRKLADSGMKKARMLYCRVSERHLDDLGLPNRVSWPDWLRHYLPSLRDASWTIITHQTFKWWIVSQAIEIIADTDDVGGPIDWLNLKLGVMIDGEYVDIIEPLTCLIREGALDRNNVIDDGALIEVRTSERRILLIPKARLLPYLQGLEALYTAPRNGETPALRSPFLLAVLARLLESETPNELAWQGNGALRDLVARLRDTATIPEIVIPDAFKAQLRDFQIRGASWLKFLADNRLGGILADEMGLGKTIQALAFIAAEKANGRLDHPALVVVPKSVLGHWKRQTRRWAPDLKMHVAHGPRREDGFAAHPDCDVVLTTYGTVVRDEALAATEWSTILCDEAQLAKNRETATANVLRALKSRVRFCLTGTPLENNLDELWAQFDFVVPGYLGDRDAFHIKWGAPIEKDRDEGRLADLATRISPFLLRRKKADVEPDLPEKVAETIGVDMGDAQRVLYDTVRIAMDKQVQEAIAEHDNGRAYYHILAALTKSRQVCCDPRLTPDLPTSDEAGSAKLERLLALVQQRVEGGHKMLIFSTFAQMLDLIGTALDNIGIAHVTLTGQTRNRDEVIRRFQDDDIPVFLISMRAGGAGLDLTVADTVILYDGWWNPASEAQAIDRVHRIGQTRPVSVFRLKTTNTIEDEMLKLKQRKSRLVNALLDATDENHNTEPEAESGGVKEEDIKEVIEAVYGTRAHE